MSRQKPSPEKATLTGLTQCQQGVKDLTQALLDYVGKVSPGILKHAVRTIQKNGMIGELVTQPVYEAIGHALALNMDMDELVAHHFTRYERAADINEIPMEPIKTPRPLQPSLPLSDYKGLAMYTDQLRTQFMGVLDKIRPPLGVAMQDLELYQNVHDLFMALHYSLYTLYDTGTPM